MSNVQPHQVHPVLLMLRPDQIPQPRSTWRHEKGNVYRVVVLTNMMSTKEDYPPTVVYVSVDHGTWWSRPLAQWHRSMTRIES